MLLPNASFESRRSASAAQPQTLGATDEGMLNTMREHFTDPELVDLVAFMGFMWAGGTFGNVLGNSSRPWSTGN